MSAIIGERDKLLRAATVRNVNPTLGKALDLRADAYMFHVAADGSHSPAAINLSAKLIGIPGAVSWSAAGATLTGSADNERTIAFADMPGASANIAVNITYEGQAYLATLVIGKVSDGATGSDADVTPEAIKAALASAITEDELSAALLARVSLIDDPATQPGSVQARVKAETDARVASIQAEADARIAAILAESGARTTYVQTYTYSKAQSDASLSAQATAIAAAYTSYADTKKAEAISAASADVRTYAYSKAAIDSAEASQSSTLTANYTAYANSQRDAAISTAAADVRSYSYSKASTDSAISASADELRSEFVSSGGATEAYVQNYAYSKSQIDAAEAAQTSSITTNYQTFASGKRDEAVSIANADVRSYAYSKSAIDSSFSSQSSSITAAYTSYADAKKSEAISAAAADVRSYSYAKATVDSAIASSTTSLTARLDNAGGTGVTVEQKFTAQASTLTGLSAQLTWKIDNNGHMTGIGLASDAPNGTPTGAVVILADAFRMVAPGAGTGAPSTQVFDIEVVGGVAKAVFNGKLQAVSGSFGSVELPSSGMINSGAFITKNPANEWPAAGAGSGFQIGNGALRLGNFNDGKYLFAGYDGNIIAPNFSIVDGVLTLQGVVASTLVTQASAGATAQNSLSNPPSVSGLHDISVSGCANGVYVNYDTLTASTPTGVGPFTYSWVLTTYFGLLKISSEEGATVTISGKSTNSYCAGAAYCTIRGANGLTATDFAYINCAHGSGVAP